MKGEREQPNGSYLVCGAERNKDLRYYSAGFIVHNFQFFRIATTLLREIFRTSRSLHPSSKKVMFIVAKILSSIAI